MTGIDSNIIVHKLQVDPDYPPVRQKRRKFAPDRNKVINEEIQKLIDVGSVREVDYPDWLANVVVVKKKNGKWRVCIDFTDLNKACPKDSFPLPHIDMMVDATAEHELLSFMDAFSGYNQILMHPNDQEKTSFITERGTFCYKVMSFGLMNAGATYQRLVNRMFSDMLGKTMEVYIDDMLVKYLAAENHLDHLKQAFQTEECEEALRQLKSYLSSPPLLAKPKDGETLYMYLAVSEVAVNVALVREDEGKQQPIYYVSKTLLDAETRYTQLEKLALALVTAGRKLRPYFQCHPIVVLTQYPLHSILHKPELSGRMTKWAVELSEYDITYQPRTAIKSQVLADFIADFSCVGQVQAEKELLCLNEQTNSTWMLAVDGSSNSKGSGLGIVLTSPQGDVMQRAIRCDFKLTNNEAEYEALIAGLDLSIELNAKTIEVMSDSELIVNQLNGSYQAKDSKMASYLKIVQDKISRFTKFTINQLPRLENNHADALANLGSSIQIKDGVTIPVVIMQWPATWKPNEDVKSLNEQDNWMTPIMQYLEDGTLPHDKNESRKLRAKAARFTLYNGKLYRRSFSGPLLRCLLPAESNYILQELHQGECGNHSGHRSLCNKALTIGYYWPTMRADSYNFVQQCDKCQRFAQISHLPPEKLHSSLTPWPFMRWGMDIVGKMPTAPGQRVFMLALTDYFSKWVEAEAFAQVRDREVKNFIWKNIICRFGIPKEIVTDNGSQFISQDFQSFCAEWGIQLSFSTPRYPQANGQAESTNKTIVNTLKKTSRESQREMGR
ncbi:uncharacterized protein LOC133037084 [Cannabis sativa]|uniref:uncharacterized protein LOC133037084 n=1 Tax=Cannabis sativa TaxID=3483 RepID=UPI0029CA323C|nr:uncharacterized protein LOC133037084 [Cannabis sativa]